MALLNSTSMVLITKITGALDIDFWPISLIDSVYKLIAKVFIIKLSKVVEQKLGKRQNVFVEGQQITEVALIANKVVDSVSSVELGESCASLTLKRVTTCFLAFLVLPS